MMLPAQDFVMVTGGRDLYAIEVDGCNSTLLCNVQSPNLFGVGDLTYTPDGQLWGIGVDARLYTINETTGATDLYTTLPNGGELFTALVADASGLLYIADEEGDLFTYDPATNTTDYIGNVGLGAAGDLTFYEGQLLMATTLNTIVSIDLDDPDNTQFVLSFNTANIFGIVTFVEDCENTVTYASSGFGEVFQIDFSTNELTQLCDFGNSIFGSASALEFLAAEPIQIEDISTTDTSCDTPMGSITLSTLSNNVMFSLNGINYQSSGTFTGLSPGLYTIYLLDDQNCTDTIEVEVLSTQEAPMIAQVITEPALCGEAIGSLTVNASGGTPPYQYAINGGPLLPSSVFNGLAAGNYEIQVVDAEQCSDLVTATIEGTTALTVTSLGVSACVTTGNRITISATGGSGQYSYSLDGTTYQPDNVFLDLPAGDFTVYLQDSNGCTTQETGIMPEAEPIVLGVSEVRACGAGLGQISVEATGGSGTFSYQLNGENPQASGLFNGLSSGTYTLIAFDETGCPSPPQSVVLPEAVAISVADISSTPSQCARPNGTLSFMVAGGTPPLSYTLNGQAVGVPPYNGLLADTFSLVITDAVGCTFTDTLSVPALCPIYLPSAFSPNDDGRNDRFELYSGIAIPILRYQIFDRWGGLVYEQQNFTSAQRSRFWDGRRGQKMMPTGVYTYVIEVVNGSGVEEALEGGVHLVR